MKYVDIDDIETIHLKSRSNRYYRANIDWDSHPDHFKADIVLALRGTFNEMDSFTDIEKCGKIKGVFIPNDKSDFKLMKYSCSKLDCHICGGNASKKKADNSSLRVLAFSKLTNYTYIRILSVNIPSDYMFEKKMDEKDYDFEKRSKKNNIFKPKNYEKFRDWLLASRKQVSNDLKESGLEGFALVFHPHRIRKTLGIDERYWSPHFHVIGMGYIDDFDTYYKKHGYRYSLPKDKDGKFTDKINKNNPKELCELPKRISYLINHSATYLVKLLLSPATTYFGNMSNGKMKQIGKTIQYTEIFLSDTGLPYFLYKPNKYMKSKVPVQVKKYAKASKEALDSFYYLMKDLSEWDYKFVYKSTYTACTTNLYDFNFEIDFSKFCFFEKMKNHDNEFISLAIKEKLKIFRGKWNNKECYTSSFEFKEGLAPHFDLLDKEKERIEALELEIQNLELDFDELFCNPKYEFDGFLEPIDGHII